MKGLLWVLALFSLAVAVSLAARWMADAWADPVPAIEDVPMRNTLYGVRIIHTRARLLPADKLVEQAAFDKYNYIRDAYLQNRRSFIEE